MLNLAPKSKCKKNKKQKKDYLYVSWVHTFFQTCINDYKTNFFYLYTKLNANTLSIQKVIICY